MIDLLDVGIDDGERPNGRESPWAIALPGD
jgi:hypothetical protein